MPECWCQSHLMLFSVYLLMEFLNPTEALVYISSVLIGLSLLHWDGSQKSFILPDFSHFRVNLPEKNYLLFFAK